MTQSRWAVGVDLGGTKIEVAAVDTQGEVLEHRRLPTEAATGPAAVREKIISAVHALYANFPGPPAGVGVGVAGQVAREGGVVRFAPNLHWQDEPLQEKLSAALGLPVVVANDVRAAAWGEWLHGAGRGVEDLVCLFVGTGIGGGVVSGARMLAGASNSAGELGHLTVDLHGPPCHCGNRGCLEALAGGWAIARRARQAVAADPAAGEALLQLAGKQEEISAAHVARAAQSGDPLAGQLVAEVTEALTAGAVGLVNAFNPRRLILGGGVLEGLPDLLTAVAEAVHHRALRVAGEALEVVPARLGGRAGVVGAAALSLGLADGKG